MMNRNSIINNLGLNRRFLQEKKQQTDYKIKYIKEYIKVWVHISASRPKIEKINFIDCMCNAGIYLDGDFCTSIEVLNIFIEAASTYPYKTFNLFLNDFDNKRIEVVKIIIAYLIPKKISNLNTYISVKDVNEYLIHLSSSDYMFKYNSSTILFVDPYDFGTVHIDIIKIFITKYYCELLFNFFISDYVRNGIDDRIKKCIGDVVIHDKDDLIQFIGTELKVGNMKFLFSYKFKTLKNTELYQIIFVSPCLKGMEVLKAALWHVFNGQVYYRNTVDTGQVSLFTKEDEMEWLIKDYSLEAQIMLLAKYKSQCVSYNEIESFLIENSILKASHIIKNVIIPLIIMGKIRKENLQNKNNYKEDKYTIYGDYDENN